MDIEDVIEALAVEQILTRVLMYEVLVRLSQQSPDPATTLRGMLDSIYASIDGYELPDVSADRAEKYRTIARMTVDALLAARPPA